MKVGLHLARGKALMPFHRRFEAILAANGIESVRMFADSEGFWDQARTLDGFVYRFSVSDSEQQMAKTLIPILERGMRIPCYPDTVTSWTYDDKIRQYFLSLSLGLPMVRSWVFYSKAEASAWAESAAFPAVFKLAGGAGSTNVILVRNRRQASALIRRMFGGGIRSGSIPAWDTVKWRDFRLAKRARILGGWIRGKLAGRDVTPFWSLHRNYALFQQYLPGNAFDTRVTIIGERAFAFRRLNREGDFRSSGSGRIDYDTARIDLGLVERSFGIREKLGAQSMAFDWLYDGQGSPRFCEMSYGFDGLAVAKCPGHWDRAMRWQPGHRWPEHCILQDLLGDRGLIQPDMPLSE